MPYSLSNICLALTKMVLLGCQCPKNIIEESNIIIADAIATWEMFIESESTREIDQRVNNGYYFMQAKLVQYDHLRNLIANICDNHNNQRFYDVKKNDFDQILLNSILNAEQRFKVIANRDDYINIVYALERRKPNISLSDRHAMILHFIRDKCNDKRAIKRIQDALADSKNNFVLKDELGKSYFPVISDFFYDLFYLEYFFLKDASGTKMYRDDISTVKKNQTTPDLRIPYRLYSKVVFINKVTLDGIQMYVFKEFVRALKCDENALRKLLKELIYFADQDGKRAFRAKMNISLHYPK
ncbi:MAG: hypothetical protein L0Y61_05470, partial [Epsilonproteobacteria bacterium]|nr:hypothetical protein [Campylobacterota bacterium]